MVVSQNSKINSKTLLLFYSVMKFHFFNIYTRSIGLCKSIANGIWKLIFQRGEKGGQWIHVFPKLDEATVTNQAFLIYINFLAW